MMPASSYGHGQYEEGYDQPMGGETRSTTLAERLCDLKDAISELSAQICAAIQDRQEPVGKLRSLNYHLEAHHDEVWQMLNTPYKFLKRPVYQDEDGESKKISADQEMSEESHKREQQIDSQ